MNAESAVVLGIDTPIGLTVVRELGARGVLVHGIAHSNDGVGLHSRYLYRGYRRPLEDDATVQLLNQIAERDRVRVLMAVGEQDIAFINRNTERLSSFARLVPDAERTALVLDKLAACTAAQRIGIDVPVTHEIRHATQIDEIVESVSYPVVLKWRNPHTIATDLARAHLPLLKAEYGYDAATLRAALGRYASIGTYPLVQSYCPGYGLGQMVFMHQGAALLRFQHRRIHEWPPEGGLSTVCESLGLDCHAQLFEKSVALLRSLRWEGPAMIEYRHDPRTGRSVFMEINGRFWGSQPLAYHAGAHFAWYTYSVLGNGVEPPPVPCRIGITCRFLLPEMRRLLTILFRARTIQNKQLRFSRAAELWSFVSGFVRPRHCYYVFSWHDPLPCLMDLLCIAGKASRRAVAQCRAWIPVRSPLAVRPSDPHGQPRSRATAHSVVDATSSRTPVAGSTTAEP